MNIALILAGGTGTRAGGSLPKQFQIVGGTRMIWWSVKAFKSFDRDCVIILVVHPQFLQNWDQELGREEYELGYSIHKTAGGGSRIESVRNGLGYIDSLLKNEEKANAKIFIHDSARPFVTPELIALGAESVSPGYGAIPGVPLADSIRRVLPDDTSVAVDRNEYRAVQTPQIFLFPDIFNAYNEVDNEAALTDDASVAEKNGIIIRLFEGDPANIKITNPSDFSRF